MRVSSSSEQVVAEGAATCAALLPGSAGGPVKPVRIPAPMRDTLLRLIAADVQAAASSC